MADWYVSSVSYAAVAQWAATHAYIIGDLVRGLATPTAGSECVFRCTTAGTSGGSEPIWSKANNNTTASGTATFTDVTSQSAFGWSAAAGSIETINNVGAPTGRIGAGDRVFLASDHAQTRSAVTTLSSFNGTLTLPILWISVSRAGSVPPVAADVLKGASFTCSGGALTFENWGRWEGCVFTGASASNGAIGFNFNSYAATYLRNCDLVVTGTTVGAQIRSTNPARAVWDNTTVKFGAVGQFIGLASYALNLDWLNTPSAIQGTNMPTALFGLGVNAALVATCRGVDFSAMGSGKALVDLAGSGSPPNRFLFANCKLNASVSIVTGTPVTENAVVELVNCDSGNTNYRCEKHSSVGDVTTETTIVLTGGASDGTTSFSRKMVSASRANGRTTMLEGFPIDQWNTSTGSSLTATVEVISSGTLTTSDIFLQLEYLGDASYPISTVADNFLATPLTASSNHATSAATWASSPATPVSQKLEVTFTPQKVGLVRGTVYLAKASTTVYCNPVMAIA